MKPTIIEYRTHPPDVPERSQAPAPVRLEPTSVYRWLTDQDPDVIVGLPQAPTGCPLANFLHHANGGSRDKVGIGAYVSYLRTGEYYEADLPPWALRFLFLVDRGSCPVNAATAQRYLRSAVRDGRGREGSLCKALDGPS
jgi:hypothetical protein